MTGRVTLLALALGAAPLGAQIRTELFLGATSAQARSATGGSATRIGGFVLGGGATLAAGRVHLELRYAEGVLEPRDAGSLERSFVDARAAVGVHATEWLTAQLGMHARARALPTSSGGERWLWGEVRTRVSAPLVGPMVRGDMEVWRAFGLKMDDVGRGSGQGGEAGLTLRLPGQRVWLRMAYTFDQIHVPAAGRWDTFDGVTLATGVSLR